MNLFNITIVLINIISVVIIMPARGRY